MVVMVTPPAFANIGYQTYIIFAVINAFMVPCVYFFYPETAYRSLEEVRLYSAFTTVLGTYTQKRENSVLTWQTF